MSFEYLTKDFIFDHTAFEQIKEEAPSYYIFPTVYIIYCKKTKKAYIGETTNILNRLSQHLKNSDKNQLKNVKVIFSPYFNKSSVLDIESNLIQNMLADKQFQLLNGNEGISNHHYYQKTEYAHTFKDIWKNLQFEKLVKHDLLDIQNSDLFKYSPYKSLSEDQYQAIREYLFILNGATDKTSTFIQGSAGTGKTILAVYLVKLLLSDIDEEDLEDNFEVSPLIELAQEVRTKLKKEKDEIKIALVVPMTSLRKTLQNVFKSIHGLSKSMVIGPNEVKNDYYDLLIVDEAHRLKRRKNITGYAEFDKTNRHFGLDENGNELDWIMMSSNNQLFFYDEKQSIRPTDIEKEKFKAIKNTTNTILLKSQMRVQGGEDYIEFVDRLLTDSTDLKPWKSSSYELKLFTSMPQMIKELEDKEKEYGLCRTISGYSWKWLSAKNDIPDVTIDGVDLYWNRTSQDWINSAKQMTEMGCIHTTQGYDLNYSGIIFGTDITYNEETQKIEVIKENYFDRNGKVGITDEQLHDYIINIYKTIMYRGIKGTYVYCCDEKLRNYFKNFIPIG
ncbi:DNA/RNA helicase domain-containing protein [Aliarcobacter butzleri]|uniref:DNA/RNA helicase domain-containing protein n=1 Tax=Aliarcobacter butzleri TaxID=28197 RepID=UPI003B222A67